MLTEEVARSGGPVVQQLVEYRYGSIGESGQEREAGKTKRNRPLTKGAL